MDAYDWSGQPVEFVCGHVFSEDDTVLGDFGDHILISCPSCGEDYRIYYHEIDGKKVLNCLAILEV